jgi:hypothetical protein
MMIEKNWLPIESAPKDGTRILAWRDTWETCGFVRWVYNPRTHTEFWNDHIEWDAYENESEPPTHWLPLPPYPAK